MKFAKIAKKKLRSSSRLNALAFEDAVLCVKLFAKDETEDAKVNLVIGTYRQFLKEDANDN